jgi:hypothetical protein
MVVVVCYIVFVLRVGYAVRARNFRRTRRYAQILTWHHYKNYTHNLNEIRNRIDPPPPNVHNVKE